MSRFVIQVHGFANGAPCSHIGQFVRTFDHEAHEGVGNGTFTPDIDKAMTFPTFLDAFEFWRKVPTCKPTRDTDGKPNRPLTAATCEFFDRDKGRTAP
jgi:hypothetical protein